MNQRRNLRWFFNVCLKCVYPLNRIWKRKTLLWVLNREDCSDMGVNQQKVFISLLETTILRIPV